MWFLRLRGSKGSLCLFALRSHVRVPLYDCERETVMERERANVFVHALKRQEIGP